MDHVSDAEVLAELVTGEYVSGAAVGKALGITRNAVNKHVKNLRATGWHIEATPRKGMMLVEMKPCEDAPVTPPALAAPVKPPPERAADVAPAPELLPPQARLAPFAGMTWVDPDDEIEALEICVLQLGRLAGPARDRVMTYLASRFEVEW